MSRVSTGVEPLPVFVSQPPPDPIENKVKRVAFVFFAGLLFLAFSPITLPLALGAGGYRLYSHIKFRPAIEEFAQNRYKAVCKALNDEKLLDKIYTLTEISEIQELLKIKPSNNMHDHMQKVREKIDAALGENPTGENATFLRVAAHALTIHADGMEVFQKWGERAICKGSLSLPYERLAKALDYAVDECTTFQKENLWGNVLWAFAHPQRAASSFFEHIGWSHPLAFNSYQHGNANIRIGAFEVNGRKIHFVLGPTATCDRLFTAHLQHLRETKKGVHAQHSVESPWQNNEEVRRQNQLRIAENYNDVSIFTLGHIEDNGLVPHIDEHGILLPENFTQNEEINALAAKMFGDDSGLSNKAHRLGLQTLIAVQGIFNMPEGEHSMGQACKQDIDRGVLVNILTILFMDQLAGKPITDERIAQMAGIVILRAAMVDDRRILEKRYEALSELLHYIAKKPEVFDPMKRHFLGSAWYKPFVSKTQGFGA
ncbi:MAG: hypothetical protein P0S96_02700 [Simkaniaceae bacterium]|nr:hypothetical protein [Candidatus Sacchlamyda saccharinae]